MATIEEHSKSMTVYYYKRTGEIKSISGGIQSMAIYGEYEEDFSLIVDYIVVERNDFIFERMKDFRVDLERKCLVCIATEQYKAFML